MGILLVYDVTDEASFNNIRNWMRNIEQHASDNVNKVWLLCRVQVLVLLSPCMHPSRSLAAFVGNIQHCHSTASGLLASSAATPRCILVCRTGGRQAVCMHALLTGALQLMGRLCL